MSKKEKSELTNTELRKLRKLKKKQLKQQEIKKQPWENFQENYQGTITKRHRCYCRDYRIFCSQYPLQQNGIRRKGTRIKPLRYQDGLKLDLNYISQFDQESFLRAKKVKLVDSSWDGKFSKTFQIQYKLPLSLTARTILNSFTNKYIYYAIDDLLYLLESNPTERDNLLTVLYSSMLSLHNDFSINFFDIWIESIYLNDISKQNRFLRSQSNSSNQIIETLITLKLQYFKRTPIKKPEPIW